MLRLGRSSPRDLPPRARTAEPPAGSSGPPPARSSRTCRRHGRCSSHLFPARLTSTSRPDANLAGPLPGRRRRPVHHYSAHRVGTRPIVGAEAAAKPSLGRALPPFRTCGSVRPRGPTTQVSTKPLTHQLRLNNSAVTALFLSI